VKSLGLMNARASLLKVIGSIISLILFYATDIGLLIGHESRREVSINLK
ncbi:MAG: hypothetical protein RLY39_668, partial [Actinomycetota bacterium]